jgi:crotonobetainyl-CoA:carnitine CoA-transferase CaiB-like acyl-CoA transferase
VSGVLDGIQVVEIGAVIAGPSAAAMLGDWGAQVVKVEPFEGDPQRGNIVTAYFDLDNRGKRSITLDLKAPRGQEIMQLLLAAADVFVTNIRPSALARLGLGYDDLSVTHPRLVYGLITGYGISGPAADRPGYDIGAFWSRAAVAGTLVGDGVEPPVPRPGMGDHTAGLALVAGIAGALFARERSGQGQLVTSSLFRTGTYVISSDIAAELAGAHPEPGMRRAQYNPLLGCYQAGDGRWFWLLGLQADRHWPNVLRAVGRTELVTDERFSSFGRLLRNAREVIAILDDAFAARSLDEWAPIFAREDVWWDPVQNLAELLRDPLFAASAALRPIADTPTPTVAGPVDFPTIEPAAGRRAPEAGEHTEEILLELGYDWDAIIELKDNGVIP